MHYFLATSLVGLAETQYALWWGPRSGALFHIELVALVVTTWIGVTECWRVSNTRRFVFNVTCLALPASMRVNVLRIAFGLLLWINAEAMFDPYAFQDPQRAYELVAFAGVTGFAAYFWFLIWRALRDIRKRPAKSSSLSVLAS